MLQHTADEPQSWFAQLSIPGLIIEDGLAVLEELHMHVHTAACFASHGLGHKGSSAAFLGGRVLDDILGNHGVVSHLGHLTQLDLDFQLAAAANLSVVIFDLHAPLFHH